MNESFRSYTHELFALMPDTEILRALISPQEMGLMQFSLSATVRFCKAAANAQFANPLLLGEAHHQVPARLWSQHFCQLIAT